MGMVFIGFLSFVIWTFMPVIQFTLRWTVSTAATRFLSQTNSVRFLYVFKLHVHLYADGCAAFERQHIETTNTNTSSNNNNNKII